MNKQHSSSVPDYAMCISILARGVPKHWIWKLVSINKEEITSCTLPDVLHHFRNKLINNLSLRMVHHVPSSDWTVPSCWSSPPTRRPTPYHGSPRPGRAGRPRTGRAITVNACWLRNYEDIIHVCHHLSSPLSPRPQPGEHARPAAPTEYLSISFEK